MASVFLTGTARGLGVKLEVAQELGLRTVQLHVPMRQDRTTEATRAILRRLEVLGLSLTAVFAGFPGESYADIPSVTRTVGLVPFETRQQRLVEMFQVANFAKQLNCSVVALHLGALPHDRTDKVYGDVLEATAQAL